MAHNQSKIVKLKGLLSTGFFNEKDLLSGQNQIRPFEVEMKLLILNILSQFLLGEKLILERGTMNCSLH